MAGFLNALSFMAPVGQTLGGAMVKGEAEAQQQQQRDAFGKMLNQLPDEWTPFKRWYQAGGSMHDVSAGMAGPIGETMRQHARAIQLGDIWNNDKLSPEQKIGQTIGITGDPKIGEEYYAAQLREAGKKPQLTPQQKQQNIQTIMRNPPTGLPPDLVARANQVANDPNANPAEVDDVSKALEAFEKPRTGRIEKSIVPDVASGLGVNYVQDFDPITGLQVGPPKPIGIQWGAQEQKGREQSIQVVDRTPLALQAAQQMEDRFKQLGLNTDPQKRDWLNKQWAAYVGQRRIDSTNYLNPETWAYTSLPGTDEVFNRYATIMGQLQAMTAGPMGIFRSQGLFQAIAPHIDAPSDLPSQNMERLRQNRDRFQQDNQKVADAIRRYGLQQADGLPAASGGAGPGRATQFDAHAALHSLLE